MKWQKQQKYSEHSLSNLVMPLPLCLFQRLQSKHTSATATMPSRKAKTPCGRHTTCRQCGLPSSLSLPVFQMKTRYHKRARRIMMMGNGRKERDWGKKNTTRKKDIKGLFEILSHSHSHRRCTSEERRGALP